jgi:hypothetical protein
MNDINMLRINSGNTLKNFSSEYLPSYLQIKKIILVNKTNVVHNISFYVYFDSLHVSGAMCPSSGEFTVSVRHLVYVTLCG